MFEKPDQQALASLLSFLLGTALGRIGDRVGCKKRSWLISASFIQAVLLAVAAVLAHYSGEPSVASYVSAHLLARCDCLLTRLGAACCRSRYDPSWRTPMAMASLGFASATLGLQGVIGKRLNTPFGTAVVLTTIWVELINEPKLFVLKRNKARVSPARRPPLSSRVQIRLTPCRLPPPSLPQDLRAASVFFLFLGAFIGRALVDVIGSGGTFAVGTGLRVVQAVGWLWVAGPLEKKVLGA